MFKNRHCYNTRYTVKSKESGGSLPGLKGTLPVATNVRKWLLNPFIGRVPKPGTFGNVWTNWRHVSIGYLYVSYNWKVAFYGVSDIWRWALNIRLLWHFSTCIESVISILLISSVCVSGFYNLDSSTCQVPGDLQTSLLPLVLGEVTTVKHTIHIPGGA